MLMLKLMKNFFYFLLPKSMSDIWSNALALRNKLYLPNLWVIMFEKRKLGKFPQN